MVKFILLLFISAVGVIGCTSNRVFVMTGRSSDASFARLNNDLAKKSEIVVVPDSIWEKRDWEGRSDTIFGISDASYDFGAPRSVTQIQVSRDNTVYTLLGATGPSRINTWHLREVFFEDKRRSRPLGMVVGFGIGAAAGTTLMAALVMGGGDEHPPANDTRDRVIAISAGAAIGGLVGLIGGIWYPVELTRRTHILFLPARQMPAR